MRVSGLCSLARSSNYGRHPILIQNARIVSGETNHILIMMPARGAEDVFAVMKDDLQKFNVSRYENNIFVDALKTGHGMLKDIFEEDVFPLFPIVASAGVETFRVVSQEKARLETLLEKVNQHNKVERYTLDKVSFAEIMTRNIFSSVYPSLYGLTDKEIGIMKAAFSGGYFEWPRVNDLEDISMENGISKVTTLYHIRKAEKKIIEKIFSRRVA
ncbi:helix-turn-helix domain-containing protein [Oxyplasma meridianum]|uniref:Helix-turn-helix domain-containing protein n=1 Tax=Oxyplasma meridianum TaxID=3073602 RepID=A0AAX4NG29_9ARCH